MLSGGGRPLLIVSGIVGLAQRRIATDEDVADAGGHPRAATANATQSLAERGVRSVVLRFPPTVRGEGDHRFVARRWVMADALLEDSLAGARVGAAATTSPRISPASAPTSAPRGSD